MLKPVTPRSTRIPRPWPTLSGESRRLRLLVRKLRLRRVVDGGIDRLRLRLDTVADPVYQPLSYAGLGRSARRTTGTVSKWEVMEPVIAQANAQTAVDVGCAQGWFALNLAARGIPTVGVESYPANYRTALYSARRSGLSEKFGLLVLSVGPETASLLPPADCTLFLSIWHHLVRDYGLERATEILATVWRRTGKILFFETGELEMPAYYHLPDMQPDVRTWLERYLSDVCEGSVVEHLGNHHGGWHEGESIYRNLFVLRRDT